MADVEGDGDADIIWRESTAGGVYIWLIDQSTGTQESSVEVYTPIASHWQLEATGHIDGDNNLDVLWRDTSTGRPYVWFLAADGSLGSSQLVADSNVPSSWQVVGLVDVTDDGVDDILWRYQAGDWGVYYWELAATGERQASATILDKVGSSWDIRGVYSSP